MAGTAQVCGGKVENASALSRRDFVVGSGLVTAGFVVGGLAPATAEAQTASAYDPKQLFSHIVGGNNGVLYCVSSDGALYWYRHSGWTSGTASWANRGRARKIGHGWQYFTKILASSDGQLFGIRGDGGIQWYRYILSDPNTGAGSWARGSGRLIGTGFNRFPRIFGGFDGYIYGVEANGTLYMYRYLASTGTWANRGRGIAIGRGFNSMKHLFADTGGVIYGLKNTSLYWFRQYGDGTWANRGRAIWIASGYRSLAEKLMLTGGSGTIYGIQIDAGTVPEDDDTLVWRRLTNHLTVDRQSPNWLGRTVIGRGFTFERMAPLQGYVTTPSISAGEEVGAAVSTTLGSFVASIVRIAPASGTQELVWGPQTVAGKLQLLADDYRSAGCGWSEALRTATEPAWPSGVYAMQLEGPAGLRRHLPFVLRPASPAAPLAVIIPTNTYHAYNSWGGHSQYTGGQAGVQRVLSFMRPSYFSDPVPDGTPDHTFVADLLLLRWMTDNGHAFDCYNDTDLHDSGDWLTNYRAVILTTHPEYWSDAMRQNMLDYLAGGGRLIYTGGNGVYERVTFNEDRTALTFREPDGSRDVYGPEGLPPSQVLGVSYTGRGFGTYAPFRVVRDHPILEGTGLRVGDRFGFAGYNGPGSGWEYDERVGGDGEATDEELVAIGENLTDSGANMVFMQRPNGGFVFSASSLTFNGTLDRDPATARILNNVLTLAVQPNPEAEPEATQRAQRGEPIPAGPEDARP